MWVQKYIVEINAEILVLLKMIFPINKPCSFDYVKYFFEYALVALQICFNNLEIFKRYVKW